MRWILGLDSNTAGYIVREETKIQPLSIETGGRALRYYDKIKDAENEILKECKREMGKKEWEETEWGKTMTKLHEKEKTNPWMREARESLGKNTVEKWIEAYGGKKKEKRLKKIDRK